MFAKVIESMLFYVIVCVVAFEDFIYIFAQVSEEMLEQGRQQYQILQERGSLPQYGPCWKAAIDHIEGGCRALTEEVQSDMALHLTNCFLEMSGHETYNCELNKKPNLKAICINNMSDRAFNVYTEFYTHTQNICWFLRGQVWHETIAENTLKVGKQLESSAKNQEKLLKGQEESLELQEKLLNYGKSLEKVMEDFYISTKQHQEVLSIMNRSMNNLQSWLLGEVSWLDTVVFYVFSVLLIMVLTASPRTVSARLPIFTLLMLNIGIERFISMKLGYFSDADIHLLHKELNKYIWICRYIFTIIAALIFAYKTITFRDINYENYALLKAIHDQNSSLLSKIEKTKENYLSNGNVSIVNENFSSLLNSHSFNGCSSSPKESPTMKLNEEVCFTKKSFSYKENEQLDYLKRNNCYHSKYESPPTAKENGHSKGNTMGHESNFSKGTSFVKVHGRYNLRTRTETPEKRII